jgi:hypothetical protein
MMVEPQSGEVPITFYEHLVMMVESRVAATIHAAKKCLFLEIKKTVYSRSC